MAQVGLSRNRLLAAAAFALSSLCHAQNLIPNPGYETLFMPDGYQWVQPQGAYYHYEYTDSTTHAQAHSGSYINGICMYPNEPNEYLHVKLLEPLSPGTAYRIAVWARLMRTKSENAHAQLFIGAYLGNKRFDTHLPGDLNVEPQFQLRLPEGNRYNWFLLADTFIARGGEQYLTVGYFPATQRSEYETRKQEEFMARIERKYSEQQRPAPSETNWLYLPPEEQKKYLKKNKRAPGPTTPPQAKPAATSPELPTGSADLSPTFRVRYYFDDWCLTALYPGSTPDCAALPHKDQPAKGKTIALQNVFFATDQATILPESEVQLTALQSMLQQYPSMRIEVRGYTDSKGSPAHNLDLSRRRAQAVAQWLSDKGIDPARIKHKGFGSADPVATNETEAGRALNRRVVFYIEEM
jgi:outer membrane protein OmpA-like peptidoglycan-associated protein